MAIFVLLRFTEMNQTFGYEVCSTGTWPVKWLPLTKSIRIQSICNFIIGWYWFNDVSIAWIMQRSLVSFARDRLWKNVKGSSRTIFFGPKDTVCWCK